MTDLTLQNEISRRRTFAIISHPDAGKTTLTEKLLLYGGAIQAAGSVRARRDQRNTTSDWMELEKERGISISSTLLQFEYGGCNIDSRVFLKDLFDAFMGLPYEFYKIRPRELLHVGKYCQKFENFEYSNWLAIQRRDKPSVSPSES